VVILLVGFIIVVVYVVVYVVESISFLHNKTRRRNFLQNQNKQFAFNVSGLFTQVMILIGYT
jgi:magnesium-transporting ATPase (P-type)